MANKMAVGVAPEETEEIPPNYADSEKLLQSCVGLVFSSNLPTADTLAKLRQRKKVQCTYLISHLFRSLNVRGLVLCTPVNDNLELKVSQGLFLLFKVIFVVNFKWQFGIS